MLPFFVLESQDLPENKKKQYLVQQSHKKQMNLFYFQNLFLKNRNLDDKVKKNTQLGQTSQAYKNFD